LAVAIPILVILLHWMRYDASLASLVAYRQLYRARQWDALLDRARRHPSGDLRVQFMTNVALYHKGRLLEEMFRYPQPWGTRGLFLNFSRQPVASPAEDDTIDGMYNSDLLYEMGHANFSLRHAYNVMCLQGKSYDTLKRMARCSILNGNYATANKYLNLLERTLFHRDFARRYRSILADPAAEEREFGELRKCLPVRDGFGHPIRHFITLLDAKPDNRMALDYLTAWLLLDKTPDSMDTIYANLRHLQAVGYASLPTHCQESMLLRERAAGQASDLQGFGYDRAIKARVTQFLQDVAQTQGQPPDSNRFWSLYGDTYMFYFFFVMTPGDAQRAGPRQGQYGVTSGHE
jgi:hypothetical protein